jgi:hypothetical protein
VYFDFLYNSCITISHSKKNLVRHKCTQVIVILVKFQWNLNFLNKFSKNNQISNVTKICLVETKLFHADRQTDMTKLIVIFHNFANMLKNEWNDGSIIIMNLGYIFNSIPEFLSELLSSGHLGNLNWDKGYWQNELQENKRNWIKNTIYSQQVFPHITSTEHLYMSLL